MKLRNVKKLYTIKQKLIEGIAERQSIMETVKAINAVLLDEGGVQAVLYPYNPLLDEVRTLWGQGMKPVDIAAKLGIIDIDGNPDGELIEMVVEDQ